MINKDSEYRKVLAEVLEVLNNTQIELVKKIPEKFMNFLIENSDKDYVVNIDFEDENWNKQLKEETRVILALIYRDYMVSEEQRQELLKKEREEQMKIEEELRKEYNPDDLFSKKKNKHYSGNQ